VPKSIAVRHGLRPRRTPWPVGGSIAAGGLTLLGNGLGTVVYPWLIYDLTGSFAWMGIVATLTLAPMVIGMLFGSVIVDHYGTRPVAVIGDLFSAITATAIAAAAALDSLSIELLAALAFAGALLDGPAIIAHEARLPEFARLARMKLARVNMIDDVIDNIASIGAPALAGLLIATLSTEDALWPIAGVAGAGAAVTIALTPRFKPRSGRFHSVAAAVSEGPRFIARTPVLKIATVLAALGYALFVALEVVMLPALLRQAGRPATELSLFLGSAGAAALVINLGLASFSKMPGLRVVYVSGFAGLAAATGLLAIDQSAPMLAIAGVLLGLSAGPLMPVLNTAMQEIAPRPVRARVLGASTALILALAPLATLLAGFLFELAGKTGLMAGVAALYALIAVAALASRGLATHKVRHNVMERAGVSTPNTAAPDAT